VKDEGVYLITPRDATLIRFSNYDRIALANLFLLPTQSQTTARQQGHNTFSTTTDLRTPRYLRMLGPIGD
jgi:hypothetical protein